MLLDGRAGSKAFEAVIMIGAAARSCILRIPLQKDVPGLRMHHAVHELAFDHDTSTDSCADRDVDDVVKTLGGAVDSLSEAGNVHVRVIADRDMEALHEGIPEVVVPPSRLRCLEDGAEKLVCGVDAGRAKSTDTESIDIALTEPFDHRRYVLLRSCRRDRIALEDVSFLIADGHDHLRAACFECTDTRHCNHLIDLRGKLTDDMIYPIRNRTCRAEGERSLKAL